MSNPEQRTPAGLNGIEELAWSKNRSLRLIGRIALMIGAFRSRPPIGFEYMSAWPPSVPMNDDPDGSRARELRYRRYLQNPKTKIDRIMP